MLVVLIATLFVLPLIVNAGVLFQVVPPLLVDAWIVNRSLPTVWLLITKFL